MELQELLDLRESMLDALRADVGMARAEQAKAKDDADRARASEDRARAELDRLRKSINRADVDSRRREGDVSLTPVGLGRARAACPVTRSPFHLPPANHFQIRTASQSSSGK
jgi:septal ring factor EnvC (AmiA/AmiB activator)